MAHHRWIDDIVRSDNIYYSPRTDCDGSVRPYRAVHLIVSHEGGLFELQVMTRARELCTVLDYSILYKPTIRIRNFESRLWLSNLEWAANAFDLSFPNGVGHT